MEIKLKFIKVRYLLISILLLISCSGDSEKTEIDIFDGGYDSNIFSSDSFKNIGFKFSKEYNVKELKDAESAY